MDDDGRRRTMRSWPLPPCLCWTLLFHGVALLWGHALSPCMVAATIAAVRRLFTTQWSPLPGLEPRIRMTDIVIPREDDDGRRRMLAQAAAAVPLVGAHRLKMATH